ncbi:MAG: TraB/GumN family protein [Methanothrix sp.]|jgi:pheromone shutdown-related protein TraB|uniref:TraB family protein n=1 Tax=Methanothrix thermoacetophila (strain DSM 6194 / JCM 14653 / NBRC 101360 / PT) TaxID=349307 RepID=A0B5Y8_METTP|nr:MULTISPECIES: TraB/GumN family protein [Methanothrix]ABK14112.1 TraB family protein [Methanothrix thermoacetophila PT]MBC7079783.1 TraB/GumN family protein [Methanothrix sp.]NPU87860.1 TraB/GumN family protein [Methanothrix sp.]
MADITEGSSTDARNEILVIGTAHVSEKSVAEVREAIEQTRPDIVAVELCQRRYLALTGQDRDEDIKVSELLSGGRIYLVLVQWLLAYIQRQIGSEMGVRPGAEMLAAIEAARVVNARVALVDRDISITIQRFWSAMSIWEKLKMLWSLVVAALGFGKEDLDIDSVTDSDVVSQLMAEFRKIAPSAARALVDERDAYIARNLYDLSRYGKVLAVVGAGHREGIMRYLSDPSRIPDTQIFDAPPEKRFSLGKAFGIIVTLLIILTFVYILVAGYSSGVVLLAFGIWFLVTGGLAALGVVAARGHPLSVLTAFMIAWMTTLNPLVAAGWFAGMVEAWKRKPTMGDVKRLASAESMDEMMENRFFRVVLVAALANLGATLGTFLGIYIIWQRMGLIDPHAIISHII